MSVGIIGSRANSAGQPTGYSVNGQQAATYDFDYDGHMVDTGLYANGNLSALDSYRYNGFGLQVLKVDSTGSYANLNDGISPGSPLLSDGTTVYTSSDSLRYNGASASTFYSGDILGSVEDVSDATGATPAHVVEYEPFGNVLYGSGAAVGSPFRYCGAAGHQTSPDSGLILTGNRWYVPAIGRLLSPDPSGAGDNPYVYCGNSSIGSLDPIWLWSKISDGDSAAAGASVTFHIHDLHSTILDFAARVTRTAHNARCPLARSR